jgi:GT2 family glycosyltransferase
MTICIPTKDRLDLLLPCLSSLAATCRDHHVDVLLGDTGSSPGTLELYRALGLESLPIRGPFSFSRACNEMARAARGGTLLFLNNDTEALTPNWLDRLDPVPDGEIVGAALVYPGTQRLQHAGVEVVASAAWPQPNAYRPPRSDRTAPALALQNLGTGKRLESLTTQRASVMAVTGAFLCTTRAQFESLGGFDEAYRVDLQDIDYCLCGRARGLDVVCRHDIVFSHRHAASRRRYAFPLEDWRRFVGRWAEDLERWKRSQLWSSG